MPDSHRSLPSADALPPPAPPLPPPPAPPLPPQRYAHRATSALARFAHPFIYGSRPPSPQQSVHQETPIIPHPGRHSISRPGASQTVTHKTGIPIAALDISPQKTHAVIAGREILKTVHVSPDGCAEDFNLRSAIVAHSSTHNVSTGGPSAKHKDQLAARDVKWSHSEYDRIIATAVANGRIVIYDLTRAGLELGRFQEHNRQVHTLAFNPHRAAWLLSGSQDATIRMWDLRMVSGDRGVMSFGSKHRFNGHSEAVRDVRWSPADGVEFATATDSGAILRWDVRKESAPLMKINAHEKPCFSVDWHPDGKHLVSGGTDRQVKVWDFSSSDRRQKPCFQFRAPQAVLNVRWRPASWVSEGQDAGNWQSTQLVTSYDQEDPRIHLWDLRRPHIPFREFERYNRSPSDLLWHSNDLLWSVSSEGTFTQTDIRFAPEVIQRRRQCAITWSPTGDVLAFAQKRPRRRGLSMSFGPTEFLDLKSERQSSGEKATSQSLTDDGLDEPALPSSLRKRPGITTYARAAKSLSGTPPMSEDGPQIIPLEKAVAGTGVFEPGQTGVIGHVSGATLDPAVFRYLAKNYVPLLINPSPLPADALKNILDAFDGNAEHAENASLYRLAQTWRIIKFAIMQELKNAAEEHSVAESPAEDSAKRHSRDDSVMERSQTLEEPYPDKLKSRLFKGVIETEAHARMTVETESTSNMTTPLARPLPDSPIEDSGSSRSSQASDFDDEFESIQPLPPSVLSSNGGAMHLRRRDTNTSLDQETFDRPEDHESRARARPVSPRSLSPDRLRERELALNGSMFSEGQRSAPRAISRMGNWRLHDPDRFGTRGLEEEDYDQKVEEKKAAMRDYKRFPKRLLSFDAPSHDPTRPPPPVTYARHDSAESFPMFSASTDSSQRGKSISEPYSPLSRPEGISHTDDAGWSVAAESPLQRIQEVDIHSPQRPARGRRDSHSIEHLSLDDYTTQSNVVHLERPSSPLPFLSEGAVSPSKSPAKARLAHASTPKTSRCQSTPNSAAPEENGDGLPVLPLSPGLTRSKPWSAHNIIREAIRHYCASSPVDMQSAAHLLHKMHILFRSCEKILPYEERELIFKTYNGQLLRERMFVEAAELRLSCVPLYPSVYDYAQQDTFINVYCFECKKPFENPTRDNRKCHRCGVTQPPCTICMSQDPPAEWVDQLSASSSSSVSPTSPDQPSPTAVSSPTSSGSLPSPHTLPDSTTTPDPASTDNNQPHPNTPSSRPHGTALWAWCQGCGHGAHTACQLAWLSDIPTSDGGCATPGCLHDCGPGPRREQNRLTMLEDNRRAGGANNRAFGRKPTTGYAKRDSWAAGESKAVERVRGMLGVVAQMHASASSAATATTAPASGVGGGGGGGPHTLSPKKVRLVTPNEQGGGGSGGGGGGGGRRRPQQNNTRGGPDGGGRKDSMSDPLLGP
ncbi:hypothetical protein AJ80_08004 [Polytolypa hystricis UAMH7299]|uniref:Uncharacterized protein n=1 Tax=Polytolypa hystricis (strain UAMH7299) TaxID=1447883 RepID=A0A2B7XF48_POLH7|nr:hypothetical protein AJ80_08004 [Polytolypa hystricis UAMH7299]